VFPIKIKYNYVTHYNNIIIITYSWKLLFLTTESLHFDPEIRLLNTRIVKTKRNAKMINAKAAMAPPIMGPIATGRES